MNFAHDTIHFPVNTEKSRIGWTEDAKGRYYTFEVDVEATKPQIKRAVESVFAVTVRSVKTLIRKGKPRKRFVKRGALEGRTSKVKRAIVRLAPGQKIPFFDGI